MCWSPLRESGWTWRQASTKLYRFLVSTFSRERPFHRHLSHSTSTQIYSRTLTNLFCSIFNRTAVNQDLGHHPRMVRWLTALFFLVYRLDGTQIQLFHHVRDEIRQVIFRQPVAQARR